MIAQRKQPEDHPDFLPDDHPRGASITSTPPATHIPNNNTQAPPPANNNNINHNSSQSTHLPDESDAEEVEGLVGIVMLVP